MFTWKNKLFDLDTKEVWNSLDNKIERTQFDHAIYLNLTKWHNEYSLLFDKYIFFKEKTYSPCYLNFVKILLDLKCDVYYQADIFLKSNLKKQKLIQIEDFWNYEYKSGYWQPQNSRFEYNFNQIKNVALILPLKYFNLNLKGYCEEEKILKYLKNNNPNITIIGLCYEKSLVPNLNKINIDMDFIITEKQIYTRRN